MIVPSRSLIEIADFRLFSKALADERIAREAGDVDLAQCGRSSRVVLTAGRRLMVPAIRCP
jgi:hypothetical protein